MKVYWKHFGSLPGSLLGVLGGSWDSLGASTPSGALGGSGCDILAILGALDRILEPLGTLLGPLGSVLRVSWESLGRLLEHFGRILKQFWN